MIVGGILTPLYAESRQTMDLDFILQLELIKSNKEVLIQEFELFRFNPTQTWNDTFQDWDKSQFIQVFGPDNLIKIDINLHHCHNDENNSSIWARFKVEEFKNRKRIRIADKECWAQSKEDFILSKLLYKGFQDYKDALGCYIRFEKQLDLIYLEKSAKMFNVSNVWQDLKEKISVEQVFSDD